MKRTQTAGQTDGVSQTQRLVKSLSEPQLQCIFELGGGTDRAIHQAALIGPRARRIWAGAKLVGASKRLECAKSLAGLANILTLG